MSLIASTAKGSTDGIAVTTDAIDTTGAGFIAICRSNYVDSLTPTDSYSNTWTGLGALNTLNGGVVEWFYCLSPVVGAGHTFTLTGSPSTRKPTLNVLAFGGSCTVDSDSGDYGSAATSVDPSSPITPAQADSLLLSAVIVENTDTLSVDAAFTKVNQVNYDASFHMGAAVAYEIQMAATSRQPAWSWTTATHTATHFAVFAYAPPVAPPKEGCHVLGIDGTVDTTRTGLINLDGVTRTVSGSGIEFIGGSIGLIEQSIAPTGIANTALLYAEDSGAGKTRLMAKFGTGSAIQLAVEP
jgi:hypothetical protein